MIDLVAQHGAPRGVAQAIDQLDSLCQHSAEDPELPVSTEFGRGVIEAVDKMDQMGQGAVASAEDPGHPELYVRAAVLQQSAQGTLNLDQPYNEVGTFDTARLGPDGPAGGAPRWSDLNNAVTDLEHLFGVHGSRVESVVDGREVPLEVSNALLELRTTPGVGTEMPRDASVPRAVSDAIGERVKALEDTARDAGYALTPYQGRALHDVDLVATAPLPPVELIGRGKSTIPERAEVAPPPGTRFETQEQLEARVEREIEKDAGRPTVPNPPAPAAGAARDAQAHAQQQER